MRLPSSVADWMMAAATTVVLVLTGTATTLGPRWSGLLTPFPVFAGTLAAFTHRSQGPDAAADFLRGVVSGSFGYAVFFLVVGAAVEDLGIGPSFAAALVAAVACQAPFGRAPRRPAGAESGAPFSQ